MTPQKKLDHYRTHMKVYGFLLLALSNRDDKLLELIDAKSPGSFMTALRDMIENAQEFE